MCIETKQREFSEIKQHNLECFYKAFRSKPGNEIESTIREYIIAHSFLETYKAWEYFLPKSIFYYLFHSISLQGTPIVHKEHPANIEEAEQLIKKKTSTPHPRWTDSKYIQQVSELLFEPPHPYETVKSVATPLQDMKIIRTVICHNSSSSIEQFKSLIRRTLTPSKTTYSPAQFLGEESLQAGLSFYEVYIQYLQNLVNTIANF